MLMVKKIGFVRFLVFVCVLLLSNNFSAQELPAKVIWQSIDGISVPIPPQTHPRLYIRACDIPELKKRLEHPLAKRVILALDSLGKGSTVAEESKELHHDFRYYYRMRGVTSRVQLQALD